MGTKQQVDAHVAALKSTDEEQLMVACEALWHLSQINVSNLQTIREAGAIAPLVFLLREGSDKVRALVAGALLGLACDATNREEMAEEECIGLLVDLVSFGTDEQKANAAGCLSQLATDENRKQEIRDAGGISPLVALVSHGNDAQKEGAAGALWSLSTSDENPFDPHNGLEITKF